MRSGKETARPPASRWLRHRCSTPLARRRCGQPHGSRWRRSCWRLLRWPAVVAAGYLAAVWPGNGHGLRRRRTSRPSPTHPFGTDWMGRDMLAAHAGRPFHERAGGPCWPLRASSVIALDARLRRRRSAARSADAVVTWLIDLMMGIPHIVLLILISFALGKGFWGVTIGVAVTHWPSLARVVRAEILQCRESTFVAVARKLGQSPLRIALKPHGALCAAAVHSGAHPAVSPCHPARGGRHVPRFRPAARAAGHRCHLERVDGVPLGRHVVARGVPRPRAHRHRALVRRGRARTFASSSTRTARRNRRRG